MIYLRSIIKNINDLILRGKLPLLGAKYILRELKTYLDKCLKVFQCFFQNFHIEPSVTKEENNTT